MLVSNSIVIEDLQGSPVKLARTGMTRDQQSAPHVTHFPARV